MSVRGPSIDDICQPLDAGRAVILGLVITDAFWTPDASGIVADFEPDTERGGHAVLAVGHGYNQVGTRIILTRNSWGKQWGLNGYAWLTQHYLARQLYQTALLT